MKSKYIVPIFVPHAGCGHQCIFCNQVKIAGVLENLSVYEVKNSIDELLELYPKDQEIEIAYYGGSFTGIERERRTKLLDIGKEYIDNGLVKEMRVSTRPDLITIEILEELKYFGVKTIELGVQSFDEEVLKFSKRGHTVEHVFDAVELIHKMGFTLGIQTLIGLPLSSEEKEIVTAKMTIKCNPKYVRIYPLIVFPETELQILYQNKEYTPLSLENAVEICAKLMDLYDEHQVIVIRMGLQSQDGFGENIIAGPYHPAFRQLVESKRYLDKFINLIENRFCNEKDIVIEVDEKVLSNAIGHKKCNLSFLKSAYPDKNISFKKK